MALQDNKFLDRSEIASITYHDIFGYPLSTKDIIKWRVGKKGLFLFKNLKEVLNIDGLYFIKGKENLLYKKALGERVSVRKMEIAKKCASILSKFSSIKGVFITGALAMNNAKDEGDIDLMIITKRNNLWTTRMFAYLALKIMNFDIRKPNDKNQIDKLCLNIWLDESALSWNKNDRNIYSAHEIAQIVPIINKDNIYQRFLFKNNWILGYWPNSVRIEDIRHEGKKITNISNLFERVAYLIQYKYMKSKITKEKVGLHKGIFHPRSWKENVLQKLST
jgi:D-beta-D-heptose 7-phosphate kinase/D-beta-D-heptose 1-phosphate adenosyltransferase